MRKEGMTRQEIADFFEMCIRDRGEQGCSIPGAADVCRRLAQLCPLYLVTNGVKMCIRDRCCSSTPATGRGVR